MSEVIRGKGAPTMTTEGAVGQIYIDTDTGIQYQCVEAEKRKAYNVDVTNYLWVLRRLNGDFVATDDEVRSAMTPIVFEAEQLWDNRENIAFGDELKELILSGRPVWFHGRRQSTDSRFPSKWQYERINRLDSQDPPTVTTGGATVIEQTTMTIWALDTTLTFVISV